MTFSMILMMMTQSVSQPLTRGKIIKKMCLSFLSLESIKCLSRRGWNKKVNLPETMQESLPHPIMCHLNMKRMMKMMMINNSSPELIPLRLVL